MNKPLRIYLRAMAKKIRSKRDRREAYREIADHLRQGIDALMKQSQLSLDEATQEVLRGAFQCLWLHLG